MSIDLDAIRNRLKTIQNGGGNASLWKPSSGEQVVRFVPYRYGDNPLGPFVELKMHYDLPGSNFVSPISFTEEKGIGTQELVERGDPVAEFANHQRRTNGDAGFEIWKTLYPTNRVYAPVLVRGEEDRGVRFWGFSMTVYEELLEYFADPDWGDLSDPKTGRDIKVKYLLPKDTGEQYPKTKVAPSPRVTPLAEDKETLRKYYDQMERVEDVFDIATEEELEDALQNWLKMEDEADEEEEEPVSASLESSDDGEEEDDFDDAFNELFDEDE